MVYLGRVYVFGAACNSDSSPRVRRRKFVAKGRTPFPECAVLPPRQGVTEDVGFTCGLILALLQTLDGECEQVC